MPASERIFQVECALEEAVALVDVIIDRAEDGPARNGDIMLHVLRRHLRAALGEIIKAQEPAPVLDARGTCQPAGCAM
jgi:hypothetical protein